MEKELFEKKSQKYSDRPILQMLGELSGFNWTVPLMRYGETWRRHRRLIHKNFSGQSLEKYQFIQEKHARNLVQRLLHSPKNFVEHTRHATGAIIMEITYGIKVQPKGDPYIKLAETAIAVASQAGSPGAFLVDVIPILKHIPEWFPGASFQRKAGEWRKILRSVPVEPMKVVKNAFKAGTVSLSLASTLLEQYYASTETPSHDEEEIIQNVTGVVYVGGADTTVCALEIFFLAMILYPKVQKKAHEELDRVITRTRFPTFEDRRVLPYVSAICKEVLRWHPVTPLAVPHSLSEDDIIVVRDEKSGGSDSERRYFVPAGTIVFGNSWAILHSEELYGDNVNDFVPERFLKEGVRDPDPAFGFGRRVCPGRDFAEGTLFIMIASVLQSFNILPIQTKDGPLLPREDEFTGGVVSRPHPFECDITPRSSEMEELVRQLPDGGYMDDENELE
ncbi:hypothetical protein Clacol_001075 [Clathrus columnatus]|uniref:Cytochrome P450 n=1 Tax=Clathrus columnatus TaxID=1419009 RepID=A0AAV5A2B3_9AGAM|nr:hypothetical protein Clacol_001075 [Clathrus columnatus]